MSLYEHDRSASIPLPAAEPRCEPAMPCVIRGRCARYMAALKDADPVDFSATKDGGTALCDGLLLLANVLRPDVRPGRNVTRQGEPA